MSAVAFAFVVGVAVAAVVHPFAFAFGVVRPVLAVVEYYSCHSFAEYFYYCLRQREG